MALARGDGLAGRGRSLRDAWESPARAGRRLSWARKLGIEAAAMVPEWREALPTRIAPVEIIPGGDLLPHALWLATYARIDDVAFQTSRGLELINSPERVRIHSPGRRTW